MIVERRIGCAFIIILLTTGFSSLILPGEVFGGNRSDISVSSPFEALPASSHIDSLVDHDPIEINGNDDFVLQGWPGSGTRENPFVINNLEIASDDVNIRITNTTDFFVIRNCNLTSMGDWSYEDAILFENVTNGSVEDCHIGLRGTGTRIVRSSNCTIKRSEIVSIVIGVKLENSENIVVRKNTLYHNYAGIYLSSVTNSMIVSNTIHDNLIGVIVRSSVSCLIDRNTIYRNTVEENVIVDEHPGGVDLYDSNSCVVSDNSVFDNLGGIYLNSSPNCTVISNLIYDNIRGGLTLISSPNGRVIENVFDSNGVYVSGELDSWHHTFVGNTINRKMLGYYHNDSDLIVDGSTIGQVILAECVNVTVVNCDFSDTNVGAFFGFSLNCSLRDSVIADSSGYGIHVVNSTNSSVENVTFHTNRHGIRVFGSSNTNLHNNSISGNSFWSVNIRCSPFSTVSANRIHDVMYGIWMQESSNSTIQENTITNLVDSAIHVHTSNSTRVNDNTVEDCYAGIWMNFCSGSIVENNHIRDGYGSGIVVKGLECVVRHNTVHGKEESGIWIANVDGAEVQNNSATGNRHGIYVWRSMNSRITNNSILFNKEIGVWVDSDSRYTHIMYNDVGWNLQANAQDDGRFSIWDDGEEHGNRWGDYDGPGHYRISGESESVDRFPLKLHDPYPPIINHPKDKEYGEGATGQFILWMISEAEPGTYRILRDGIVIESGEWIELMFSFPIDDLLPGVYNFTIVVTDEDGNSAHDIVIVRVRPSILTARRSVVLVWLSIAVISIVSVVVYRRKKKP
ncbi:MAG: right-handed parallel beta-helix repeat-containing protein [Candidatus Thorarchaeota archaeon]|nr:MAG: right-handed parallel beta-helix repeat-containing protein [Candidatus Thorarchaeota archaeon]